MEGSRPASATGYRPSSMHATYPSSSSRHRRRPHDTALGEARDQQQQSPTEHLQQLELPITYTPFKFESRRVRIDWRLLHGVEISKLVRDTDLDALEALVSVITWGDIEAEDTRHLSEGSFVKVFRLAQLLLEYLLYVQENLKFTNGVLEHGRSSAVQQAQALTSRCRELYGQLKHCKRELKRASKTAKTYELMAAAVGSTAAAAAAAQAATVAAATAAAAAQPPPAVQQQQQQQQSVSSGLTAGEVLLQGQLTALTERLALAVCEAERLRDERQELQYQIRHLHDTLAAKLGGYSSSSGNGGFGSSSSPAAKAATMQQQQQQQAVVAAEAAAAAAADELEGARALAEQLQAENGQLRSHLQQQQSCAAADAAGSDSLAALQAQLEAQGSELAQLQGELREREATIKVFETNNAALQAQLEALQRQHAAPEAATPSFVAKQRQQLAAAAAAQGQLQAENVQLAAQVLELRLALDKAGGARGGAANEAASANEDEYADDPLGAAERMLRGSADAPPSAAAAGSPGGGSDWKVAEIERLQQDNRQLVVKVTALQERLHELERENGQLQRRCVSAAASPAGEAGVQLSPRGAIAASGGWNSVSSSGPAAELTAADLAADVVQVEELAPAQEQQPEPLAAEGAKLLPAKADAAAGAVAAAFGGASSGGGSSVIAAYRPPQEAAPPSSPVTPPPPAAAAPAVPRGSIDQAAASQMRALMAQLSADMTPEQLAEEYAELASDWDKPFDLTDEEKADFRALLPHEADGLPHVLTAHPTPGKAITANKARLLGSINRQLDAQLASYGIHPGRTGLSNLELLAATKMLSDRRAAQEASLSQAERDQLEVTRLALMLHPYNALQATLAGMPEGPDGKQRLPPQEAALVSAVRPPAVAPALKLQAGNNSSSSTLPSPTMVAQQQQQAVYAVSGGEAGSPTRAPYSTLTYHAAAAAAASSPGADSMRSPSPLGSEANGHPAVARAAGSGATFSPLSAALAARHRPLGGSSGGAAAGGGFSAAATPAGVELFVQQRSNNTAAAAAAAVASKQYLTASFESDDF